MMSYEEDVAVKFSVMSCSTMAEHSMPPELLLSPVILLTRSSTSSLVIFILPRPVSMRRRVATLSFLEESSTGSSFLEGLG